MCGKCFIINECNFKDEVIKEIKKILLENDYSPIVAEEIVSFNVLLFDHKILRPMLDADFIPTLELLKNSGVWAATACPVKGYSYELRQKFPWFILDKDLLKNKCAKH